MCLKAGLFQLFSRWCSEGNMILPGESISGWINMTFLRVVDTLVSSM